MVYGGALASGALTHTRRRASAGTATGLVGLPRGRARRRARLPARRDRRLVDRRPRRPPVPRAARPLAAPDARPASTAPSAGSSAGTTGPSSSAASRPSRARSSRSRPASSRCRSAATTCSRCSGTRSGASSSQASAGRSGRSYETLPPRLPLRRDRGRRGFVALVAYLAAASSPRGYDAAPADGDPPRRRQGAVRAPDPRAEGRVRAHARLRAVHLRPRGRGVRARGGRARSASQETVSCANGTDALVLVLDAMGIGPGDEVICPSFTFYATAEAIARRGATPVFADIDPTTLNLDPARGRAQDHRAGRRRSCRCTSSAAPRPTSAGSACR